MQYCNYYQAIILREKCWFFTAALRSVEHLAFDRTIDVVASVLEFYVPVHGDAYFRALMTRLEAEGIVSNLQQLPNRLCDPQAVL